MMRKKLVFTSREHIIAVEARDKGLLGLTLRYPYVRNEVDYLMEGLRKNVEASGAGKGRQPSVRRQRSEHSEQPKNKNSRRSG